MEKNQTEIQELKGVKLENVIKILDHAEGRRRKLRGRAFGINKREWQGARKASPTPSSRRRFLPGQPQNKTRGRDREEGIAQTSGILREREMQLQKAQRTPSNIKLRKITLRHETIRMLKVRDQGRMERRRRPSGLNASRSNVPPGRGSRQRCG